MEEKMDEHKLKEVLHYIIENTSNSPNVFKTHLFKILYFADFNYYELNNKLITNATYAKLPKGPAPRNFDSIVKKLISEGKVKKQIIVQKFPNSIKEYRCGKYISLLGVSSKLTLDEIKVIDEAISLAKGMTATQISEYSHGDAPWKLAKDNDDLDPELVFYRTPTYAKTQ
jgi:hypothetical protein